MRLNIIAKQIAFVNRFLKKIFCIAFGAGFVACFLPMDAKKWVLLRARAAPQAMQPSARPCANSKGWATMGELRGAERLILTYGSIMQKKTNILLAREGSLML